MHSLPASYFAQPTLEVARKLIGAYLVHECTNGTRMAGRIVETEAYGVDDPACHAWSLLQRAPEARDHRSRAADLLGPPGTAYVYLNYGVHWLLNVVTEPEGVCGAVLIRAVEPTEGIEAMRRNRPQIRHLHQLASGPGKLSRAFGIDGRYHGAMLTAPPLYLAAGPTDVPLPVGVSGRIGIRRGVELPWRFFLKGSPYVSGPAGGRAG